jgi:hypothetical protein
MRLLLRTGCSDAGLGARNRRPACLDGSVPVQAHPNSQGATARILCRELRRGSAAHVKDDAAPYALSVLGGSLMVVLVRGIALEVEREISSAAVLLSGEARSAVRRVNDRPGRPDEPVALARLTGVRCSDEAAGRGHPEP